MITEEDLLPGTCWKFQSRTWEGGHWFVKITDRRPYTSSWSPTAQWEFVRDEICISVQRFHRLRYISDGWVTWNLNNFNITPIDENAWNVAFQLSKS